MTSPKLGDLDPEAFYTPDYLAPIMGFKKAELRRYCIESGIHARLARNSIRLTVEDARSIRAWVLDRNRKAADWAKEPEAADPFA